MTRALVQGGEWNLAAGRRVDLGGASPGGDEPRRSSEEAAARPARAGRDFLLAGCLCAAVVTALLPLSDELFHWFVLPVTLCGVLTTVDALDWLRGRFDRFDPRGLIGLLGCHFFFLAPLLHVCMAYFMPEVSPPADWREWLGGMALLNALGLLAYRLMSGRMVSGAIRPSPLTVWSLNERRFFTLVGLALPVTALLQVWVYAQFGGITGYIEAATEHSFRNSMPGMGMYFIFSESFPLLAMMAYAVAARRRAWCRSWATLALVLAVFFVLVMLFGGLRANRSNVVWNLFWAVAIVHFCIRPVRAGLIALGIGFLVLFMYGYGLYREAGVDAAEVLQDREAQEALASERQRTLDNVLLADFGRSDVQAFLLYRVTAPDGDYEFALGRTYAAAPAIIVPRALWPDRPYCASQEGTEAQFGRGSFEPPWAESPRVYGLAGEALLNFGPVAVPVAFALWGLFVARARRPLYTWHPADARFLIYPLLVILSLLVLFQDAENLVFFLLKYGTMPLLVTWPALTARPAAEQDQRTVAGHALAWERGGA